MTTPNWQRPILFAYDGSEQAKAAIREAAAQLRPSSRALVLMVWQPQPSAAHPFAPGVGLPSDLEERLEQEAMKKAKKGAALARLVGFDATALVERGIPVWSGIADDHDASVIVMGSHGRTGLARAAGQRGNGGVQPW